MNHSEKINVGQAVVPTDEDFTMQLNITQLMRALQLPEVQLFVQSFVAPPTQEAPGGETQQKIKLFFARLEPRFTNKYQTHSVRIDTYFRPK